MKKISIFLVLSIISSSAFAIMLQTTNLVNATSCWIGQDYFQNPTDFHKTTPIPVYTFNMNNKHQFIYYSTISPGEFGQAPLVHLSPTSPITSAIISWSLNPQANGVEYLTRAQDFMNDFIVQGSYGVEVLRTNPCAAVANPKKFHIA